MGFKTNILFGCMTFFVYMNPITASASSLTTAVDNAATQIAKHLKERGIREILVDVQTLPAHPGLPAKNDIKDIIIDTLQTQGIKYKKGIGKHKLLAQYKVPELNNDERESYRIDFMLTNVITGETVEFPEESITESYDTDIARQIGVSFETKPEYKNTDELYDDIIPQIIDFQEGKSKQPKAGIKDNIVRANENGLFGFQVISNNDPVPASLEDGHAFIDFDNSHSTYQIRLFNNGPIDVAVVIHIDGIDSGRYRKDKKVLYLLPAGKTTVVAGWIIEGQQKAHAFELSPPEQSVAAQDGQIESVGTIQATFYRAYKEGEEMDRQDRVAAKNVGTKAGEIKDYRYKEVKRTPGKTPRASITARYARQ
jgi:hypothetical protein